MPVALLTNYLTPYRMPLYERLATSHGVEVLCYGRGERYAPTWFRDLDRQLTQAPFPARRMEGGAREAFALARHYDAVIAPFAGGSILLAAFAGARRAGTPFILWASVWAQPRSASHLLALPLTRRIFRRADAVVAYGEHVRRFVAEIRGRDSDVFVAPQSVETDLFGREVTTDEIAAFRERYELGDGPLVVYVGRLVTEKGTGVLIDAWPAVAGEATLVLIGAGRLETAAAALPRARWLGPLAREELPLAYAASEFALLPSVPTPRFREPWGLVCNEAMHQGRPVIATDAVGAVAGRLVRDGETGIVVPAADASALAGAIERLLSEPASRMRLGAAARTAVAPYTYEAMVAAFDAALASARLRR